jgi:hypothetical protein
MASSELETLESRKTPAVAARDAENGGLSSRYQRMIESHEAQRIADESILARFGKKQQLTVGQIPRIPEIRRDLTILEPLAQIQISVVDCLQHEYHAHLGSCSTVSIFPTRTVRTVWQ